MLGVADVRRKMVCSVINNQGMLHLLVCPIVLEDFLLVQFTGSSPEM